MCDLNGSLSFHSNDPPKENFNLPCRKTYDFIHDKSEKEKD